MTNDERRLLLTVARIMRAWASEGFVETRDWGDLRDALAPFDGLNEATPGQELRP